MLNFKKAGIFSRGSGQEDACEQEDQSGGVLALSLIHISEPTRH